MFLLTPYTLIENIVMTTAAEIWNRLTGAGEGIVVAIASEGKITEWG